MRLMPIYQKTNTSRAAKGHKIADFGNYAPLNWFITTTLANHLAALTYSRETGNQKLCDSTGALFCGNQQI